MQEALGAKFTDFRWIAQPSSAALATDLGPHSFPRISFTPPVQSFVSCSSTKDGGALVRRLHVCALSPGYVSPRLAGRRCAGL